jgi:hypothetical protein
VARDRRLGRLEPIGPYAREPTKADGVALMRITFHSVSRLRLVIAASAGHREAKLILPMIHIATAAMRPVLTNTLVILRSRQTEPYAPAALIG